MTTQRRVAVTGGASGIGAAVAKLFHQAGDEVIVLDVKMPALTDYKYVALDLKDPASIDAAVAELGDSIDVLANVAGVPGTLSDETVFSINFLGMRHLTDAVLPKISDQGAVVNVASIAGAKFLLRMPLIHQLLATDSYEAGLDWYRANKPDVPAYDFSKEAVILYTGLKGLAQFHRGVRINSVSPGPVETPILVDFEASMGKELLDGVKTLTGRHATADDIAQAVIFLSSPEARWINGTNIYADGGVIGASLAGLIPTA